MAIDTYSVTAMPLAQARRNDIEVFMRDFDRILQRACSSNRSVARHYPTGCCQWTSYALANALRGLIPDVYQVIYGSFDGHGHFWVAASDDLFLDPTLRQFVPELPDSFAIVPPDHILRPRYHAEQSYSVLGGPATRL